MEWMFLPLKRYADFSGRSRRMEYWMFVLFLVLLEIVFYILMLALGGGAMAMSGGDPSGVLAAGGIVMILALLFFLVFLALLIPSIAVAVRRLHDTNRSGWWILSPLAGYVIVWLGIAAESSAITLIGSLVVIGFAIMLLVFYFLDGTPGPNQYGEDPKGRGAAETFA